MNDRHSLGFALTKPHLKLRCFFPLYISSHYSFHPGRWHFQESYQQVAPSVTVQLVMCGLLVAHQTPLMYRPRSWFWNPDKRNGKDNDRGLCVVCFIFLSLLVYVPFVVWSHAKPGSLFWQHPALRSRLLSRRRRAVLCMRLLCLARPMWCKSCWLQVRGWQCSCLHSMPGLGLFSPSLPRGGFFAGCIWTWCVLSQLIDCKCMNCSWIAGLNGFGWKMLVMMLGVLGILEFDPH